MAIVGCRRRETGDGMETDGRREGSGLGPGDGRQATGDRRRVVGDGDGRREM